MPYCLPDWTSHALDPGLGGPNEQKSSAQPSAHGSQLESSPRLVSHSESQWRSQGCAHGSFAQQPQKDTPYLDQRREPAKATARSRLHPMPMRGTWALTDPGIYTPASQSTRPNPRPSPRPCSDAHASAS
ncbi:uncharacterized protein TrAtP1_012950 [Trichoderma atroviride]|uniref:uncharacterized protein n=1 Tax=Hypocrea atroviridis TaxID=63577 RepID=UPI00332E2A1F|nr:hypothetical protein TrAtP1_012950 [Trichoderma atroviride]